MMCADPMTVLANESTLYIANVIIVDSIIFYGLPSPLPLRAANDNCFYRSVWIALLSMS